MGGYMGLGLQKWIYSRTPRTKMYVRERLPSFTPLPKYSRTFQIKASVKENKIISGIIAICLAIFFIISFSVFVQSFTDYSKEHTKKVTAQNNYEYEKAFNFLIKSGISRIDRNNIKGAYSEFKLAYAIHQNNEYLNQLILETLSILCEDDNKYCEDLDVFFTKNY